MIAGGLHFGDVRIELPQALVEFKLDEASASDGSWSIRDVTWRDAGMLEFNASCDVRVTFATAPQRRVLSRCNIDRAAFPLEMQQLRAGTSPSRVDWKNGASRAASRASSCLWGTILSESR